MKSKLIFSAILFFSIFISCNRAPKKENKQDNMMLSEMKQNEPPSQSENRKEKIPVGTLLYSRLKRIPELTQ